MAVRAVAVINGVSKNQVTDDDLFTIHVDFAIIGSNWGDLTDALFQNFEVWDQNPNDLAVTIQANVAAAIKAYLISMNVPFGFLNIDTVRVISSLV